MNNEKVGKFINLAKNSLTLSDCKTNIGLIPYFTNPKNLAEIDPVFLKLHV